MSTMGQPAKYTLCFGENEEESPWPALHAERGLDPALSAITLIGIAGTTEAYSSHWSSPDDIYQVLGQALATPATIRLDPPTPVVGGGYPTVLLSPEWAAYLHEAGVTKAGLKSELFDRAICEWSRLPESVSLAAKAASRPPRWRSRSELRFRQTTSWWSSPEASASSRRSSRIGLARGR